MSEMDETLVEVGRFLDPAEAHMAKGLLDSAGVESFLQGENANAIVPMAFRTRLRVRQEDEATAKELLSGAELAEGEDVPGSEETDA
jgi:hypothetical protein